LGVNRVMKDIKFHIYSTAQSNYMSRHVAF
jgi:hypothetical protein